MQNFEKYDTLNPFEIKVDKSEIWNFERSVEKSKWKL